MRPTFAWIRRTVTLWHVTLLAALAAAGAVLAAVGTTQGGPSGYVLVLAGAGVAAASVVIKEVQQRRGDQTRELQISQLLLNAQEFKRNQGLHSAAYAFLSEIKTELDGQIDRHSQDFTKVANAACERLYQLFRGDDLLLTSTTGRSASMTLSVYFYGWAPSRGSFVQLSTEYTNGQHRGVWDWPTSFGAYLSAQPEGTVFVRSTLRASSDELTMRPPGPAGSFVRVAVRVGRRILGVLCVDAGEADTGLTVSDVEIVQAFAAQLALGLLVLRQFAPPVGGPTP